MIWNLSVLRLHLLLISISGVLLPGVWTVEEVYIAHAPNSVKFTTTEILHSSNLADVFSALLGYTISKPVKWSSLSPVNPLHLPEAVVVLKISGFKNTLDLNLNGIHFPPENVGDVDGQYDVLSLRTHRRFSDKAPVLLEADTGNELYAARSEYPVILKSVSATSEKRHQMALADIELGRTVKEGTFNHSMPGETLFLTELATVKAILSALKDHKSLVRDGVPDIIWLKLNGIGKLVGHYGTDSYQVSEALRLLKQVISEAVNILQDIYDGQVVVAVVTVNDDPTPIFRISRHLLEESAGEETNSTDYLNLAYQYDPEFSVAFIIILFVVILFTLSILGVSVFMWNMDPGRDSIIYRMTSQRMKKD
ncbi:LOW QUALITY PROTEIN: ATPase H(+)-transporting accessory protein 2 [Tachypleus tridentatus]|uniref:LOW QUALITY PROTEIN: ATPase H(+)-transporting accessory protein 2 n=1 Tax=Tachypleus tridentatus TaxID=6853 RepID=UPI003FD5E416